MSDHACCAHLKVVYVRKHHEGGMCSDSWECADCKLKFEPKRQPQQRSVHKWKVDWNEGTEQPKRKELYFDEMETEEQAKERAKKLAAQPQRSEKWMRCPSTHCERRQECASPNDCLVKEQPPATDDTCPDCHEKLSGDDMLDREIHGRCHSQGIMGVSELADLHQQLAAEREKSRILGTLIDGINGKPGLRQQLLQAQAELDKTDRDRCRLSEELCKAQAAIATAKEHTWAMAEKWPELETIDLSALDKHDAELKANITEARAQRDWLLKECARVGVTVNVQVGAPITEAYRLVNEVRKPLVEALEAIANADPSRVGQYQYKWIAVEALSKVKQ